MPWQKWPKKPIPFEFKDTDLIDLPRKKTGLIPYPEELKNCDNLFLTESWDIWYNIVCAAKCRLKKKYPKRIMAKINNGDPPLFSLKFNRGSFKFKIHEDWVAQALELPNRIEIKSQNPWEVCKIIMPLLPQILPPAIKTTVKGTSII